MSRRVLTPRPQAIAKAGQRMAPGGRLWSESPIRPFNRPVGEAGDESGPVSVLLRPVLLEPYDTPPLALVGGAGNNTLADLSDGTYARMDGNFLDGAIRSWTGSVKATFDNPDLGWEPTSATFTMRARCTVNPTSPTGTPVGQVWWMVKSQSEAVTYAHHGQFLPLTQWYAPAGFVEMPSATFTSSLPSAADVSAGVKVLLRGHANGLGISGPVQVDASDVWLLLEGMA